MGGGSSVDISAMNPAFRLSSYLYRPLPTKRPDSDNLPNRSTT